MLIAPSTHTHARTHALNVETACSREVSSDQRAVRAVTRCSPRVSGFLSLTPWGYTGGRHPDGFGERCFVLCRGTLTVVTVQPSHTPLLPLPPLSKPVLSTVVWSLVCCNEKKKPACFQLYPSVCTFLPVCLSVCLPSIPSLSLSLSVE